MVKRRFQNLMWRIGCWFIDRAGDPWKTYYESCITCDHEYESHCPNCGIESNQS